MAPPLRFHFTKAGKRTTIEAAAFIEPAACIVRAVFLDAVPVMRASPRETRDLHIVRKTTPRTCAAPASLL